MSPVVDVAYQLRIRNADNTGDAMTVSSRTGDPMPYIAESPDGDGERIDVVDGSVEDGMYDVLVADAPNEGHDVTALMADAGGKYVLLGRRAYIEESLSGGAWAVRIAGYVESIDLIDGITYKFSIGDTLRIERTRQVFDKPTPKFPKVVSLLTGGVPGGWLKAMILDRGKWRMKVVTPGFAGPDEVELEFVSGQIPTAEGYRFASGSFDSVAQDRINALGEPYRAPRDVASSLRQWWYPGLVATLTKVSDASVVERTPIASHPLVPGHAGEDRKPQNLLARNRLSLHWPGTAPTVGDLYDVTVTPLEVSERSPLHIEGHPVDVLADLWEEAGIALDATSKAAVRAAIGASRRVALRITERRNLAEFQESVLFGPFGFAFREGGDAIRRLMMIRHRGTTVPSAVITVDEMLGDWDEQPSIFHLRESLLVRHVSVVQMQFVRWTQDLAGERPTDDVRTFTDTFNMPADPMPERGEDVVYQIPGVVYLSEAPPSWNWLGGPTLTFDSAAFARALCREILNRFQTGCPLGEIIVSDDADAELGSEVVLDIDHQVNGTVRGGQRIVQVIGRTIGDAGDIHLTLLDAGQSSQIATVPTFTLTASTPQPENTYTIALTNAATLAAAGWTVRVEFGTGGSAPADGTLLAMLKPADETTITTRVDAGSHVWIRMRSEHPDRRPSDWSAWSGLNLTDLSPPTSLTNSGNVLSWTPGETAFPEEVFWRLATESASADRRVMLLPAGTASFDLTGYVPAGTSIVATVRTRDELPYQGVSTSATLTYTTPAAPALSTPIAAVVWQGPSEGGFASGDYGMEATLTEQGASLEVDVAVETAAGSGTPGAWETQTPILGVIGEATRFTASAPRDGKRRYMRARAVREGSTPSGYTGTLSVLPWAFTVRAPVRRGNLRITDDVGAIAYAARAENTAGTTLPATTVQTNGTTVRSLVKGHMGADVRHGDVVDFVEDFADVPIVLIRNGVSYQPESKWGTAAEVDADDGSANDAPAATAQYDDTAALGLTTSGFTVRARLRQRGTPTLRTHDFAANDLDVEGEATAAVVLTNAPAGDDKYTTHFSVFLDLQSGPVEDSALQIIVAAETRKDGGSWLEGASQPYSIAADGMGGTANQTWPHETLQVTVDDLDTDDEIRLILKSVELVGAGASITDVAVHGFVAADPDNGVTYTTETGPKFASKTPETDDRVQVHAMAVS